MGKKLIIQPAANTHTITFKGSCLVDIAAAWYNHVTLTEEFRSRLNDGTSFTATAGADTYTWNPGAPLPNPLPRPGAGLSYSFRNLFYGLSQPVNLTAFSTGQVADMSDMFMSAQVTSLNLTGLDTSHVLQMSDMFASCICLSSVTFGSGFDTSSVQTMQNMFSFCSSLTTLDVSGFDTGAVTNMNGMFNECSTLSSLDVSGFNTEAVTDMERMFFDCASLTALDVSHFDTKNVTTMNSMFYSCRKLNALDVSHFNTGSVTDMNSMFSGCEALAALDVSHFDTGRVTDMNSMFSGCEALAALDATHFDTSKVTDMKFMFNSCKSLAALDVSGFDTSAASLRSMFNGCQTLTSLDVSHFDTGSATSMSSMFSNCSSLTSLNLSSFDTSKVTDMEAMFNGCMSLSSLDLSGFHTEQVTNMNYMFSYCKSLTSLNLDSFQTGHVTGMYGMFYSCNALTSLNLASFDTSNVTEMTEMFFECAALASLNLSSFDTRNVTGMESMFSGCTALASLDLTSFDTSKVGSFHMIFSNCSQLTTLKLPPSFVTSKAYTLDRMFYQCEKLSSIDLSGFHTGSVTDFTYMFYGCQMLNSVSFPASFTTAKASTMRGMFSGCTALSAVDVSGFDTGNVTDFREMFQNTGITDFSAGASFVSHKAKSMDFMFAYCPTLISCSLPAFTGEALLSADHMFNGCSGLLSIDLRSLDFRPQTTLNNMLYEAGIGSSAMIMAASEASKQRLANSSETSYELTRFLLDAMARPQELNDADLALFYKYEEIATDQYKLSLTPSFQAQLNSTSGTFSSINGTYTWHAGEPLPNPDSRYGAHHGKLTSLSGLFDGLDKASAIDISLFNMETVTDVSCMFKNCSSLAALNLYSFPITETMNLTGMFTGTCSSNTGEPIQAATNNHDALASLNDAAITGIDTAKLSFIARVTLCFDLNGHGSAAPAPVTVTYDNAVSAPSTASMEEYDWSFDGWYLEPSCEHAYDFTSPLRKDTTLYAHWTQVCLSDHQLESIYSYTPVNIDGMEGWALSLCGELGTALSVEAPDAVSIAADGAYAAYTWKTGDPLPNPKPVWDGKPVLSLANLFQSKYMKHLDLSLYDTSNARNMSELFYSCYGDTISLDGLDTAQVTDFNGMFSNCTGLTELDLAPLDLQHASDLEQMFLYCSSLRKLRMENNVIPPSASLAGMFTYAGATDEEGRPALCVTKDASTALRLSDPELTDISASSMKAVSAINQVKLSIPNADKQKGSFTADHVKDVACGTKVTLSAVPKEGEAFVSYTLLSPADLAITDNSFTMPYEDVEIVANFHSHQYVEQEKEDCLEAGQESVEITCSSGRIYHKSCAVCGIQDPDPAAVFEGTRKEHAWDEGCVTTEPTCLDTGLKIYSCTICGTSKEEILPKLPHTIEPVAEIPSSCYVHGTASHYICTVCTVTFSDAAGTIPVSAEDLELPYASHTTEKTDRVEPSETENGVEEYYLCSVCGHYYADAECLEEISEPVVIPALGHSHSLTPVAAKPATCEEDGCKAYWFCDGCGLFFEDENASVIIKNKNMVVLPSTGHDWGDWTIAKEATETEDGEEICVCRNDPTHILKNPIPKTGGSGSDEPSENTGSEDSGSSGSDNSGSDNSGNSGSDNSGNSDSDNSGSDNSGNSGSGSSGSDNSGSGSDTSGNSGSDNSGSGNSGSGNSSSGTQNGSSGNGSSGKNQPAPVATKLNDPVTKTVYVVISSSGEQPAAAFQASSGPDTSTVTIPDTVTVDGVSYQITSIASGAFQNRRNLKNVKIGKHVKIIEKNAFKNCKKLASVRIGKNVERIGDYALAGCVSLKKITLPAKVTFLGKCVFSNCPKLKTITLKTKKLASKTVSKNAWKGVSKKAVLKVPKAVKKRYASLFRKKGLPKKTTIKD